MRYFPLFFDLRRRKVVIVGGGEQAAQKVRLLLKTEANIFVLSPEICEEIASHVGEGRIYWIEAAFTPDHLDGAALVYATLSDNENWQIALAARRRNIPVNAVDMPALCDVITPAIVDRDPVVVAIGTEGTAPILGRRIKTHLESHLPQQLGRVAVAARKMRAHLGRVVSEFNLRKSFWERFWSGEPEQLFLEGKDKEAWLSTKALLRSVTSGDTGEKVGRVSLVGAGPGSADLLTFRAMQRLQEADIIVYDRLIDPSVMECPRRDAERIYVGKMPGQKCVSQHDINEILIREARSGKHVVRLKSGDPMVFGRIGEEMAALQEAGIDYDIVPGVTSATACAAEAGVPLTIRDDIRSIVSLTGHCINGPTPYDWSAVAQPGTVLALYMAVKMAPTIRANLLAVGAPANAPVTIVEKGCTTASRTIETTLADMEHNIRCAEVENPAMILIHLCATQKKQAHDVVEDQKRESVDRTIASCEAL